MKKILITLATLILIFVGAFVFYQAFATDTMNELLVSRFSNSEESEETVESIEISQTTSQDETSAQASQESTSTTVEIIDKPEPETTSSNVASSESEANDDAIYMPDATFYSADGQPLELQSLKGKPIIINFWASWCPPCVEEMPDFQEAYEQYGDEINFVMLNATESRPGETIQAAQDFLVEHDLQLPVYYDQNYANQMTFGISTLPSTLFINSDGEVVYGHRGLINLEQLEFLINDVLE